MKRSKVTPIMILAVVLLSAVILTATSDVGADYSLLSSPSSSKEVTQIWSFPTNGGPGKELISNGVIHVGTVTGGLYAINAVNGAQLWSTHKSDVFGSSPALADGLLIESSNVGSIYAFDAATGKDVWTSSVYLFCGPVEAASGRVYVRSAHNNVVDSISCLDASSGATLWNAPGGGTPQIAGSFVYTITPNNGNNGMLYAYMLNGDSAWRQPVVGGPFKVAGNSVYLASNYGNGSGCVYAFDATTGALRWQFKTYGSTNSPMLAGNTIYDSYSNGPGPNNSIFDIDSSTGTKIWSYPSDDTTEWDLVIANNRVFVGSGSNGDGNIIVLDASTGTKIWNYTTGTYWYQWVLNGDEVDVLATQNGNLYGLDASNGDKIWSYPTSFGSAGLSASEGKIYVFASNAIYALQTTASPTVSPTASPTPIASLPTTSPTPSQSTQPLASLLPTSSPTTSVTPTPSVNQSYLPIVSSSPQPTETISDPPSTSSPSPSASASIAASFPFWLWVLLALMAVVYLCFSLIVFLIDRRKDKKKQPSSPLTEL